MNCTNYFAAATLAAAVMVSTPTSAAPVGLKAPDNNPALVKLAAAFATCGVDKRRPENSCRDAIKAFNAAVDKTADITTLVNLLEDEGIFARFAAAVALKQGMHLQRAPARAHADRILKAAAAESSDAVAKPLAHAILQGDFDAGAYAARVEALVISHRLPVMRAALASNLVAQGYGRFAPILKTRLSNEKSEAVREAMVGAFYTAPAKHADDYCPLYVSLLGDRQAKVAAKAAYNLVWSSGHCHAYYDQFLDHFDKRVADKAISSAYLRSAGFMAQASKATAEQKTRFLAACKKIVATPEFPSMARSGALGLIGRHAPDAKAFARKYLRDPESMVAGAAKRIVTKK